MLVEEIVEGCDGVCSPDGEEDDGETVLSKYEEEHEENEPFVRPDPHEPRVFPPILRHFTSYPPPNLELFTERRGSAPNNGRPRLHSPRSPSYEAEEPVESEPLTRNPLEPYSPGDSEGELLLLRDVVL